MMDNRDYRMTGDQRLTMDMLQRIQSLESDSKHCQSEVMAAIHHLESDLTDIKAQCSTLKAQFYDFKWQMHEVILQKQIAFKMVKIGGPGLILLWALVEKLLPGLMGKIPL